MSLTYLMNVFPCDNDLIAIQQSSSLMRPWICLGNTILHAAATSGWDLMSGRSQLGLGKASQLQSAVLEVSGVKQLDSKDVFQGEGI